MILQMKIFIVFLLATIPLVTNADFTPSDKHTKITAAISHIMTTYHYEKNQLDDGLSKKIFSKYIENLDKQKIYFNKIDIQILEKYSRKLDEAIKKQKLKPVFEIYKVFQTRFKERTKKAITLITSDFDFTVDENFQIDRTDSNWMSENNLQEYWRKRVKHDYLNLKLHNLESNEIRKILKIRYLRMQEEIDKLDADDVYSTFISSYINSIDLYSNYFPPVSMSNKDLSKSLQLAGLGLVLDMNGSFATVSKLVPGGPADLNGKIQIGDKIVGIAQDNQGEAVNTIGLRLDDIVDMIRGSRGSYVKLSLLPANQNSKEHIKTIRIMRDKVTLEQQHVKLTSQAIKNTNDRIAIISIPSFYIDFESHARGDENYISSTNHVNALLDDVKQSTAKGLLIDLRGNGGGSLLEATELSGLFVHGGPILQTKDSQGRIEGLSPTKSKMKYEGPLAILVDRHSAAAAEILTAAMQDYRRAIIIGEQTYGHGMIATIIDLNRYIENKAEDYGRLKLTIAKTYRINGKGLQNKGVMPDFIFPTNNFNKNIGVRFAEDALPWDAIKPAKYISASAPTENFSKVIKQHQSQLQHNKSFQALLKQQNQAAVRLANKSISLQESKRRAQLKSKTNIHDNSEDIVLNQSLEILHDLIE